MSEYFVDTSYKRSYVVVSATADTVILRPVDDQVLNSYWCEFISGYVDGSISDDLTLSIYITQLPKEVLSVSAYVDYVVEYPRVEIKFNDQVIDISDRVSVNHPNPETPGLYALDFVVSFGGGKSTPIWRSWVSIEEIPILRRVITPWNRENKTIANLNRLIIEPQVTEALYEAGVPIYNFQQANANSAVSQFASQRYKNARAFVKDNHLFVSGPKLPVGTEVTIQGNSYLLGATVMCLAFSRQDQYVQGDIVSYCGSDFYALHDIPLIVLDDTDGDIVEGSVLPTSSASIDGITEQCWLQGAYYTVDDMTLSNGEYVMDSLWAGVDVNGYLFKMDLLRAISIHHYWGHYNRDNFFDYAPGDLVSVVADNVISFYQRNETSIDGNSSEEAYRPGHYRNPHWVEVYSESNDTMLRNPVIRPYSNATNAVVSKTYPVRDEAFRMYANMVGMPTELVSSLGAKYSVILWALLYRTRETFPGIKVALNAIGLDISNLHRAYPSVKYDRYGSKGEPIEINDIYSEIDKVREIAKSVAADRVWTKDRGDNPPDDSIADFDMPPWITYSADGSKVMVYDSKLSQWTPFYSFTHLGSDTSYDSYDYSKNNRYYLADVNLMARLQKECSVNLDDGLERIEHNYFVKLSLALAKLLNYEIPIYVYFRLKLHLAAIGHTSLRGVSHGALYQDAWCEPVGLKVYPGKVFNFATCSIDNYYPVVLFSYDNLGSDSPDSAWVEKLPNYRSSEGYLYYAFDQAVYIRMKYPTSTAGSVYKVDTVWTSRYTLGCLGDENSMGTDDSTDVMSGFVDASNMDVTTDNPARSRDLYLCKGMVGCTLHISTGSLRVDGYSLQWNYIFGDPAWTMDEILQFASWNSLDGTQFAGTWIGTVESFKDSIVRCTSPDLPSLIFKWGDEDTPTLYIGGGIPHEIVLWDGQGVIRGIITVPYVDDMVLKTYSSDYTLKFELHPA